MPLWGNSAAPAAPAHTNATAAKRTIEPTTILFMAFLLTGNRLTALHLDMQCSIWVFYRHFECFGAHLNPDSPADGEEGEPHEHGRDGAGEQDEGRPLRDEQRLSQGRLHHLRDDGRQHHGGDGVSKLPHEIPDPPEEEHDPYVERKEPDAVGAEH